MCSKSIRMSNNKSSKRVMVGPAPRWEAENKEDHAHTIQRWELLIRIKETPTRTSWIEPCSHTPSSSSSPTSVFFLLLFSHLLRPYHESVLAELNSACSVCLAGFFFETNISFKAVPYISLYCHFFLIFEMAKSNLIVTEAEKNYIF